MAAVARVAVATKAAPARAVVERAKEMLAVGRARPATHQAVDGQMPLVVAGKTAAR